MSKLEELIDEISLKLKDDSKKMFPYLEDGLYLNKESIEALGGISEWEKYNDLIDLVRRLEDFKLEYGEI